MKNRLFLIIIGLCFVSLIGAAFLHISRPKTEVPTKTESVQESNESTDIPENSGTNPLTEGDAFSEHLGQTQIWINSKRSSPKHLGQT